MSYAQEEPLPKAFATNPKELLGEPAWTILDPILKEVRSGSIAQAHSLLAEEIEGTLPSRFDSAGVLEALSAASAALEARSQIEMPHDPKKLFGNDLELLGDAIGSRNWARARRLYPMLRIVKGDDAMAFFHAIMQAFEWTLPDSTAASPKWEGAPVGPTESALSDALVDLEEPFGFDYGGLGTSARRVMLAKRRSHHGVVFRLPSNIDDFQNWNDVPCSMVEKQLLATYLESEKASLGSFFLAHGPWHNKSPRAICTAQTGVTPILRDGDENPSNLEMQKRLLEMERDLPAWFERTAKIKTVRQEIWLSLDDANYDLRQQAWTIFPHWQYRTLMFEPLARQDNKGGAYLKVGGGTDPHVILPMVPELAERIIRKPNDRAWFQIEVEGQLAQQTQSAIITINVTALQVRCDEIGIAEQIQVAPAPGQSR